MSGRSPLVAGRSSAPAESSATGIRVMRVSGIARLVSPTPVATVASAAPSVIPSPCWKPLLNDWYDADRAPVTGVNARGPRCLKPRARHASLPRRGHREDARLSLCSSSTQPAGTCSRRATVTHGSHRTQRAQVNAFPRLPFALHGNLERPRRGGDNIGSTSSSRPSSCRRTRRVTRARA
jgi:hypothetical protein